MTIWVLLSVASLAAIFFASLHFALRDFSLRKLEVIAGRNGGIGKLESILDDPAGHSLAIGAFRTISSILLLICLVLLVRPYSIDPEAGILVIEWPRTLILAASGWTLLFFCSFLLPASIAEHLGEKLIHAFAPLIRLAYVAATPLRFLAVIDGTIKLLAGGESDQDAIADQILSAVSEGEREGNVDTAERKMIEAVVEFKSQTVEEIMTPRTEIEGLAITDNLSAVTEFIADCGHSRIPVYDDDLDHIIGILYAKDLLNFVGRDVGSIDLRPVLRKALFVPETKPLNELLLELQARKVHIAIVLDEYGGTTGLVTIEDLLEEIVGEIQDEYEQEEPASPDIIVDEDARKAELEARAYIDDANECLRSIGVELPESEDYETVGGFVVTAMGRIPEAGEQFVAAEGISVTVLEAEPTRVSRLLVEAMPPMPENGDPSVAIAADD